MNTKLSLTMLGVAAALAAQVASAAAPATATWNATGNAGIITGTSTVPVSPIGNSQFGYVTTFEGLMNVSPLQLKTDGRGNEMANNGSKVVSSVFSMAKDESLSLYFNYVSTDGRGYDDYAWARLVSASDNSTAAWLFTARSTNSARGNVVPGDVLKRQTDNSLPDQLDAVLNNGNSIGFNVSSTVWAPLGSWSGYCWDTANTCGPSGWIGSEYTQTRTGSYFIEIGVVNWGDQAFDSALAFDFAGLQGVNFRGTTTVVPEPENYAMLLAGLAVLGWSTRRSSKA